MKFGQIYEYLIGYFRRLNDGEWLGHHSRGLFTAGQKKRPMIPVSPLIPAFLPPIQGLVGEKYGSIRVPGEVESAEFEMILDAAVEAGLDTHILEEWYCRDENSVPPAYYLKPKAQMLKNFQNSVSSSYSPPLRFFSDDKGAEGFTAGLLKQRVVTLTVLSAPTPSDGVKQCSQNQERQGLEEHL